jgi:formate-dependent nitrite reductase cytochrome c552 subunit
VRESYNTGTPIPWIQIHKTPDYVYFNHSVHVNRGVSCVECHGQINKMEEVYHAQPLSMSFCLDCHRQPELRLRPLERITDLNWKWNEDPEINAEMQKKNGRQLANDWRVQSLESCSTCHR